MQQSEVTTPRSDHPTVYLSYSREDIVAAARIAKKLQSQGFDVFIDRWSIAAGEDWKSRIAALIHDADKFVILLSPNRVASALGTWELDLAHSLGKQIVPVIVRVLDASTVPSSIAALNFIVMTDAANYDTGMQSLISALSMNLDWIREHTRYLQRAREWDAGGRLANRLLSGPDIETAKVWVARHPRNAPSPTELQLDFIKASEAEALRQQSAEAQRLMEVAKAQDERARALAEREEAQAREIEAQKREAEQASRVMRRTRVGLAAAVALAFTASTFGIYAYAECNRAESSLSMARDAQRAAYEQKMLAEAAAERAKVLEAAIRRLDPGNPVLREP
jgi:TIR domain